MANTFTLETGLHDAVLYEDKNWINALLNEPGVEDLPAEDGLTGFAIALGYMNTEIVTRFLKSKLQSVDMVSLANEVLELKLEPNGDPALKNLQKAIKDAKGFQLRSISVSGIDQSVKWRRETKFYIERSRYPLVNPKVEEQERFYKNKTWLKRKISIRNDRDLMVELANLQHLVLGKFCIRSPSVVKGDLKWKLENVEAKQCQHEGDR